MANFIGDSAANIFTGGADADTAHGNEGADQLSGNGGNDILAGGSGSDTLDGGADDDRLYSSDQSPAFNLPYYGNLYTAPVLDTGTEVDTLQGGDGDDRLFAGYGDNVDGGANRYWGDSLHISFMGAPAGVTFDFRLVSQVIGGGTIQNIEGVVWVQGSNYGDYLNLQSWANGESSTVFGMGGNDTLIAGYQTGLMDGGDGNDVVDGRNSGYLQSVDGGAGDDTLYTAPNTFGEAKGGDGNDTIYSHGTTYGGAGNDIIILQWSYYAGPVRGEAGDDDITASAANHNISGGSGADVLRGDSGNDTLVSGDFAIIFAVPSNQPAFDLGLEHDTLSGGGGNDILSIGYGDDADGGTGTDTLWLSLGGLGAGATFSTAGIVSGQPFVLGGGTIQNIETLAYLRGTNFNDNLTIATQVSLLTIDAGDGDDIVTSYSSSVALSGGSGNDRFNSGIAGDTFDGGVGQDTAAYGSADAGITLTLAADGQTTAAPGGDQLVNVENLDGSAHADSLTGNALGNVLGGGGGDDTLTGSGGNDTLDGGAGADILRGGADHDIYVVDHAADVVEENAGEGTDEVRTSLASASLAAFANIENLTGISAAGQSLTGNAGSNVVTGGAGNDVLRLQDGGDDTARGGAGLDTFFFIGSLDGSDVVDGGDGVDTLVVQGPYGALTLTANVTRIENLSLLAGSNTNFGEPGTNRYDYVLTTHDSNFAAGVQARINGAALLEGEDFTFDGRAETDASFVVYGGKGRDTLLGGLGNDIFFYAEERFASGDTVNGGAGYDGMFLRGNYTIDFNAPGYTGLFTNIENLTLTSATDERYARGGGTEFDYNLVLSDAIVNAGQELTISGALLMATETMILDASQETDGRVRLFGGKSADSLTGGALADLFHGNLGADILAGGGGADAFRYQAVTESYSVARDHIVDFTPGTDKIELDRIDARTNLAGDQAFTWIGSNAFSNQAGQLRAFQQGAQWIVEGDINGDGFADLVIALTLQGPTSLGAGDFLL